MVAPLAIDLRLLRDLLLPDVRIAPGRTLAARVVAAENGRGSLSIAGYLIEAELPAHVRAGQELHLQVRDVSADRVLMQIADPRDQSAPPPPPMTAPLPGGGALTVTEKDGQSSGSSDTADGVHTLSLRYDAPALGPLDLRFSLDGSSLTVAVAARAGEPYERARGSAETLRSALQAAVERPVSVAVSPRRDPVDFYA